MRHEEKKKVTYIRRTGVAQPSNYEKMEDRLSQTLKYNFSFFF